MYKTSVHLFICKTSVCFNRKVLYTPIQLKTSAKTSVLLLKQLFFTQSICFISILLAYFYFLSLLLIVYFSSYRIERNDRKPHMVKKLISTFYIYPKLYTYFKIKISIFQKT